MVLIKTTLMSGIEKEVLLKVKRTEMLFYVNNFAKTHILLMT